MFFSIFSCLNNSSETWWLLEARVICSGFLCESLIVGSVGYFPTPNPPVSILQELLPSAPAPPLHLPRNQGVPGSQPAL